MNENKASILKESSSGNLQLQHQRLPGMHEKPMLSSFIFCLYVFFRASVTFSVESVMLYLVEADILGKILFQCCHCIEPEILINLIF